MSLVLLACYANACGSGSTSTGGIVGPTYDTGTSSGYGSSTSSSGSSSGTGDDATIDGPGDDSSGGSSSGSNEGGSSGTGEAGDEAGSSSGADGGSSSSSSSGADGGSSSSSSSGADSGSSSSSSSGGADSGSSSSSSGGPDSGSSSSSSSSGGADSGGVDSGPTCDMTGAWALKIVATVTWPATGVVAAGTGTTHQVNLWALVQGATQNGTSISVTVLPCGITLPDFTSILAGVYGVTFPSTLFDKTAPPYLPATNATLNVGSTSPGATFTSPAEANLLGISFANPTTAAWPNVTTALADQVDMDLDSHPGVTANAKSGTGYTAIPVDLISGLTGTNTASHLYMTLRSEIALNGSLAAGSCTSASGSATVSHMDNHTVGCELTAGGSCNATQYQFVDTNSPVLTATSATFQSVKLANAANCPNVRAALP